MDPFCLTRPLRSEGPGRTLWWVSRGLVRPRAEESSLQELTVGGGHSDGELIQLGIPVLPFLYF